MTNHPVKDAFPDGATTADAVRQNLALGFGLSLLDPEAIQDMDLTGLVVPDVRVNGIAFVFDAADETSAHDGVTTLVSQDGQRFKAQANASAFTSVLALQNDPPLSPMVGDTYIVGLGPTGDWAANADDLTVYTSRGWEFVAPVIGQRVYVRDIASDRQWSEAGAWAQLGLTDGSVGAVQMQFPFGMPVESETATPPGGTPAQGTKWIVAANALLAWDDWDGDVAEADGAGGFIRLTAYDGATVYDRSQRVLRSFDDGTGAWLSTGGAVVGWKRSFTAESNNTIDNGGTNYYDYEDSTAPHTGHRQRRDQAGVAYVARAAGAKLVISYDADIRIQTSTNTGGDVCLAVFRDSETNAIAWHRAPFLTAGLPQENAMALHVHGEFEVEAPDTASHSYQVSFTMAGQFAVPDIDIDVLQRRLMQVREASA